MLLSGKRSRWKHHGAGWLWWWASGHPAIDVDSQRVIVVAQ